MNQSTFTPKSSLSKRPFRLVHQTLCLSKIDFLQCVVVGFTQLVIWPLETTLRRISLNVRQCRVHRVLVEAAVDHFKGLSNMYSRVHPPTDVPVAFSDPCIEICKQDCKFRTLDNFEIKHASIISTTDPDEGGGELTVRIPPAFLGVVQDKQPLLITIEFSLTSPKYGFHFVVPEDNSLETVYAFTGGPPNSSRSWFPCVDCSEPCTWKIEITVDEDYIAIAPGELLGPPEYTDDLRAKTYQFYLAQPISAPSIGLVIGAFEIFPDRSDSTGSTLITHFCPKGLRSLLQHSVQSLAGIVEYYEGELASQFPFHSLDIVFVDRAFEDHQSFASLIIFSVDLLYSPRIIDQAITTRRIFSFAVAQQFFGCALQAETWTGAWLPYGIAGYLAGLYQKRVFGNNEYRYFIAKEMRAVTGYEHTRHGIVLDPSNTIRKNTYFSLKHPQVLSPDYLNVYIKKSHLVIRMLGLRFGQRVLLQVFNKLFVLARLSNTSAGAEGDQPNNGTPATHNNITTTASSNDGAVPPMLSDENRANLLLSTDSFRRIISTVTGQDIENFLDHWVFKPGHVRLFAKFLFNRKRNVVELELKQDLQSRSTLNYTGPMTAMLQELDGPFMHTFKLEEGRTSKELQCHSKSRKHKKKKIPLSNGDEVEMDLSRIDPDSPLLWLRLDPDLTVIRSIHTEQSDFAWHLMLAYDRDCLGQLEAVHALVDFASPETRHALSNIVADEQVYYRVRTDACFVLCRVANELASIGGGGLGVSAGGGGVGGGSSHHTHQTSSVLIPLFWQLYSSPLTRGLVRQNDFSNLQRYFLQKAIVRAVATLRVQQVCPRDVLNFLVELNRYNDNSRNTYSDCYYRAELIKAMKDALTSAIVMRGVISVSSLPLEVRTVVEEVARCLNHDAQIPSYKRMVTVACLLAIRRLQRFGFLPVEPKLFYKAAAPGHYTDVRMAAIECLVDYVRGERDQTALDWLFSEIIEKKGTSEASYPRLRYETVRLLIESPPFARGETGSRLDTPELVDRIWSLMNQGCSGDSRLRCALTDLYFTLYGNRRPSCLPLADGVLLVRVREGRSMMRMPEKEVSADSGGRNDGNEGSTLESTGRTQLEGRSPLKRRMEHLSDDDDEYNVCADCFSEPAKRMDIRVRLRPWLESRLNEGWIEGLCWVDQEKGIFRIPWKHHSKHTWTEQDAAIFKDWAVVTGRYREGIDDPDWPMWKTRLRCALNKAPDIQEVKQRHNLHCDEPFKVYRFISKTESLWRANATRNASMIFDGLPSLGPLPNAFNVHNFSARRNSNTVAPVHQRRPTILISRFSSLARNESAPYHYHQNRPLAIIRRRDQLFVKKLSLRSILPSSPQVQNSFPVSQHFHQISTGPLDSLDVGAVQEVFSSPSQFSGFQPNSINSSVPVLHPPSFLPLLPDIMEPEFHQLGVRIQHLNIRVRDAIVTNPNGCCIYFGRFDEILLSNPPNDSPDDISITSSPDAIEMAITHNVADENRAYVDLLLSNMIRGIIVTASSNDGSIYVRRLCRCAVFVYYFDEGVGEYVLIKKVFRRECVKIFDYPQFAAQLEYYRLSQGPKPHFEVVLAFGQQLRPGLATHNLLVWCRVASCRAWFQVQRVISALKTSPDYGIPLSFPTPIASHQSVLVGDEVSPISADDIDICVSDRDGVEVSLYSPSSGIKLEPEGVEEEVIVSTSLGDEVASSALIDGDHSGHPADGEVIAEVIEEEGVVEIPQDESLLTNLAVE